MENERSVDTLARHIIRLGGLAIMLALCWFLRKILVYIVIAFVVSLIGQPLKRLLKKVTIKGKSAPDALLTLLSLAIIFTCLLFVVKQIIPITASIVRDASLMNATGAISQRTILENINEWVISIFPNVGPDFDATELLMEKLSSVFNMSSIGGFLGSFASTLVSLFIGAFATLFISFFFIKDETLFRRIVRALVPDSVEAKVDKTIHDIERLLSRYFVGIIIEVFGVMLLDFLGLWLIARIGVNSAIGIAFIAGILNVIPYVGPFIGEVLGVVLCVILKYGAGVGLNVPIWAFALIVFAVMLATQMVDSMIYQPVIYSTSIKAHPLEIFIVLLIAGGIGGAVGLLAAIPTYTVVRVIASRFFSEFKPVRRLIPDIKDEYKDELL
ncbi:MAG: AI-2E family transporter [Bacteroidales bacterium]|nr:AI-2E family transporter [Bacteroidales bacterium]MBQ4188596.1 AI-2E family transporter [Bacteroidales bacterium]